MNYLFKFDFEILYNSNIEDGILKCSQNTCDLVRTRIAKRNSLLFDQIFQLKTKEEGLEEILVVIDFSNFMKSHKMTDLNNISKIELYVYKVIDEIDTDERKITVVDFLKSNSMSRDCEIYYINNKSISKEGKNLSESLLERVFFGFQKEKTVLSKLYAYSGTICSDCTILDDIQINEDEVVVVKDKHRIEKSDCVTMISMELLCDKIKKIKDYLKEKNITLDEVFRRDAYVELQSYANALTDPMNNIANKEIVKFLTRFNAICREDKKKFTLEISQMNEDYAEVGSKVNDVEWERIFVKEFPFDLNLFDGEGIISLEFCEQIRKSLCAKMGNTKYESSTSFQIRLPYVKGMVHSCDFKGFFKEKGNDKIQHIYLNDGTIVNLENVKMILTESQFKAASFMKCGKNESIKCVRDFFKLINKYNYHIGVIDANQKRMGLCSLEYQFISTLPLSKADIDGIYSDNKWRINGQCSPKRIIKSLLDDTSGTSEKEKEVFNLNRNFYFATKKYINRKKEVYNRLKNKARFCKFDVLGTRRYLSGDLLEFLYYIGFENKLAFTNELSLRKNQFYMPARNPRNSIDVFLRSPHYSRNEIVVLNRRPVNLFEEREKYFSHLTGIVMINPSSLASERLGGADYDGDTVLVIRDKKIVQPVLNSIVHSCDKKLVYDYLPCKIPSLRGKTMQYDDYADRLQCLQNTFSSRVGILSYEAIIRSSIIYDKENSVDNNHAIISDYTMLNGLEIDSAKSGRKPKFTPSKYEDIYDLKAFMKAKNDYELNGDISSIRDYNYNYWEDEFEGESYGSNICYASLKMSSIELFNDDEYKYKNNNDLKTDCLRSSDYPKTLAIALIYANSMKLIRRLFSKKAKQLKKNRLERIYHQLDEILSSKNINADDFLLNFDVDNIKAFDLLKTYVTDNNYHYLSNYDDKIQYLKKLFDIKDSKYFDALADFSNDGFRLVFIYLNYALNKVTKIVFKSSEKERERINNKINHLNQEESDRFKSLYSSYEKKVNEIIDRFTGGNDDTIKKEIIDFLKKEAKTVTFGDVFNVINIYDSNMIFDVFFDTFKEYVEGTNG